MLRWIVSGLYACAIVCVVLVADAKGVKPCVVEESDCHWVELTQGSRKGEWVRVCKVKVTCSE